MNHNAFLLSRNFNFIKNHKKVNDVDVKESIQEIIIFCDALQIDEKIKKSTAVFFRVVKFLFYFFFSQKTTQVFIILF